MDVSAAMVKSLRDKTGMPMGECKKALVESGGDEAGAIDIMRSCGALKASEFTARTASEGRIGVHVADGRAAIIELNCETAPVASTDEFQALVAQIARTAAAVGSNSVEELSAAKLVDKPGRTVAEEVGDVFNRLREKLHIARVATLSGQVGFYLHFNGQVGVICEMSAACPDEAKADVCMHYAAMRPRYVRRDEVPADDVDKERAIAREQVAGKPANIVDKIVEGKLNTWFGEICLLEQPFVKDDKRTVQQYLDGVAKGLTVNKAIMFKVGG